MVNGQAQGNLSISLGLALVLGLGGMGDRAQAAPMAAATPAMHSEKEQLQGEGSSPVSRAGSLRIQVSDLAATSEAMPAAASHQPPTTISELSPNPLPPGAPLDVEEATHVETTEVAGLPPVSQLAETPGSAAEEDPPLNLDLDPAVIDSSPVLQRWLEAVPDVAADIKYDPAFRPRLRAGYALFPSNGQTSGFQVGVQDWFIGRTPLTLSADYSANSRGDRASYGIDAQYYLLPLGWYGNVAPVLGYRRLETPTYEVSGLNVGFRIVLIPSRTGAADLSLSQTWVAPGTPEEVGLTTVSVGYAVTRYLRIATDIQTQNAPGRQDSRVGVLLEWLL